MMNCSVMTRVCVWNRTVWVTPFPALIAPFPHQSNMIKTQRGDLPLLTHLDVDVGSVAHQELQTERPVAGGGSEVERGEAFLVHLVDIGPALYELVHHHVLPIVAGNVEGRVPICV